jgi:hypothetical protein
VRCARIVHTVLYLLVLFIGVVLVPVGCGGGGTDTSKYPPGQSPKDEDIRQQMIKGEQDLKKAK